MRHIFIPIYPHSPIIHSSFRHSTYVKCKIHKFQIRQTTQPRSIGSPLTSSGKKSAKSVYRNSSSNGKSMKSLTITGTHNLEMASNSRQDDPVSPRMCKQNLDFAIPSAACTHPQTTHVLYMLRCLRVYMFAWLCVCVCACVRMKMCGMSMMYDTLPFIYVCRLDKFLWIFCMCDISMSSWTQKYISCILFEFLCVCVWCVCGPTYVHIHICKGAYPYMHQCVKGV